MKDANYPTSQSVFYQTCRIIMQNCSNSLAQFTAFSAAYTAAFITSLVTAIEAAEAMPSEQARALTHETMREELVAMGKTCRNLWQGLKRYITKAYSEEYWKMNWDAAGWENYEAASNENWDKMIALMNEGMEFIDLHTAELTAMPAGFKTDYKAATDALQAKYLEFSEAKLDALKGTDEKITANNDVYAQVIEICLDGQYIFSDDDTMREQFSFEKMSELVKPVGAAGLKGTVTKNGEPQPGITVELENGNKVVITDAEGAFDFGNKIASGKDTLILKQGDEILMEEEVTINPGVVKKEEIVLPVN